MDSRTKPVIGFFALYYHPALGGAERSQHSYFKELISDFNIHATCFMHGDMNFSHVSNFSQDKVFITQSNRPAGFTVEEFINKQKPDLITAQLMGSDVIIHHAHQAGLPIVFFAHGIFEDVCMHQLRQDCVYDDVLACPHGPECPNERERVHHLEKYLKCHKIICNSEHTKEVFEKVFPEVADKLMIVYPNFDSHLFEYRDIVPLDDKIKVLAVNSSPLKGRDLIFEIAKRNQDFEVVYVDCRLPDTSFLQSSKNITILPKVDRETMASLFQDSHVTLMPTVLQETFSSTAAESILSGTPVLSTRKGNLVNLVKTGISGDIIDVLDPGQWADKIREYARVRVDKKFSDELREKVNPQRGVEAIKNVFNSLLKDSIVMSEGDDFLYAKDRFEEYSSVTTDGVLPDKNKKILFFAKYFYPPLGGGEYFILSALKHLKKQGYECEAVCYAHPQIGQSLPMGEVEWDGIKVYQLSGIDNQIISDFYDQVNSEYMQKAVERYVGKKIERIICPMLARERVIAEEKNPEYIVLVNPDAGKGGRMFLNLAKTFQEEKFLCVGLGDEVMGENAEINREIKSTPNIKLVEKADPISEIYAQAKMVLIPSLVDETFSMVALEAMANGIPVLASSLGNLRFLISKGGEILDPIDLMSWKNAVKKLLEEKEYYNLVSKEAIDRSNDFLPEDQLEKFENMVKISLRG
jgi:glycosyltransferase involved in cell wall biosynthesis